MTPIHLYHSPREKNKRLSPEPRFNCNFTRQELKRFSRGSNGYPGWDVSPLQDSSELCQVASTDRCYPFIHLGEERPYESKLSYPNNTTQ